MSPSVGPSEYRRNNNINNNLLVRHHERSASNNPTSLSAMSDPCLVERAGALLAGVGRPGFLRYEDEDDDDFSTDGSDSDQPRVNSAVGVGAGVATPGGNGVTDRRPARISKALLQNRGKIPNARVSASLVTDSDSELTFSFDVVQQRNLKQKFVALLKKFKITEDLENEADEGCIDPSKLTGTSRTVFIAISYCFDS